jgi:hypothetical protein
MYRVYIHTHTVLKVCTWKKKNVPTQCALPVPKKGKGRAVLKIAMYTPVPTNAGSNRACAICIFINRSMTDALCLFEKKR